jgi:hypothetical protein
MRAWRDFILTGALACAVAFGAAAQPAEQRVALVIGNGAYPSAPLANPVNDAKAIAGALRQVGFEVIEAENVPLKQMMRDIVTFGGKLKQGGVGLFYYAGHGLQVKGQNYLVPVDAQIEDEGSVRIETVPVDLVAEQMGDAANRLNVVVLDACRNNPFERRMRGGGRGLAAMDAATGTLIAYATAPGSVAADGEGKNGLYTGEFLKALQQPGLKVEDVFKQVRISVIEHSHGAQTPWETSSLTGDFYFRPPTAAAPAAALPIARQPAAGFDERELEVTYWKSIEKSDNPQAFQGYLRRYPKGTFVEIAQRRIAELSAPAKGARPPAARTEPQPSPLPAQPPPQTASAPPVVAALPPAAPPPPAAPAQPADDVPEGRWKLTASGGCTMTGELSFSGATVKAKLSDAANTYDLAGTVEDGNLVKAFSTGSKLYRIEGRFPELVGQHIGKSFGSGFCSGVKFTLTKIE